MIIDSVLKLQVLIRYICLFCLLGVKLPLLSTPLVVRDVPPIDGRPLRDTSFIKGGGADGYAWMLGPVSSATLNHLVDTVYVCEHGTTALEVRVLDLPTICRYHWYRKGEENLSLDSLRIYHLNEVRVEQEGMYYCTVSFDWGGVRKELVDSIYLRVKHAPLIVPDNFHDLDTFCFGAVSTIVLNSKLENIESKEYIYRWEGNQIYSDTDTNGLVIAPIQNTSYYLEVEYDKCITRDTFTFILRKDFVQVPTVVQAERGKDIEIHLEKSCEGKIEWQMGGSVLGKDNENLTIRTERDTLLSVSVDAGNCVFSDTISIFVREDMALGGEGDGYSEPQVGFEILGIDYAERLCQYDSAVFTVKVSGDGVFDFAWKKRGSLKVDSIYGNAHTLVLDSLKLSDSGDYYCIVTDVQTGVVDSTDDIHFTVIHTPVIRVTPESGYEMCYGQEELIDASATDLNPEKGDANYVYAWTGDWILSEPNANQITVLPKDNITYYLKVTNEEFCSDSVAIHLGVKREIFIMPTSLSVMQNQEVVIVPEKGSAKEDEKLLWYLNGEPWKPEQNLAEFREIMQEDAVVKGIYTNNACSLEDSTIIWVRGNKIYAGALGDGYSEGRMSFHVAGVDYTPTVCERSLAWFDVKMSADGMFAFEWKKVGVQDSIYGNNHYFKIDSAKLEDNGNYYCVITDVRTGYKDSTEIVELKVVHRPYMSLVSSVKDADNKMCYGEETILSARSITENNPDQENNHYVFEWKGARIVTGQGTDEIKVLPLTDAEYVLIVTNNDQCADTISMTIGVKRELFVVPTTVTLVGTQELRIVPEKGEAINETIQWYDATGNVLSTDIIFEQTIADSKDIFVEYTNNGCILRDTIQVLVRNENVYKGTRGDGYSEPDMGNHLLRVDYSREVCERSSSWFDVKMTGVEATTFEWRKLENQGEIYAQTHRFQIDSTTLGNAGHYYCLITNLGNKQVVSSDTVYLTVIHTPKIKLSPLKDGFSICYEEVETLSARETEYNENKQESDHYTYQWEGAGILSDPTLNGIEISPRRSNEYQVVVTNNNRCSDTLSQLIEVKRELFVVPTSVQLTRPNEPLTIAPEKGAMGVTNWFWNGEYWSGEENFVKNNIVSTGRITVQYDNNKCTIKDSIEVVVRQPQVYTGHGGDGYGELDAGITIVGIERSSENVCERDSAWFRLVVSGLDAYGYEWKKRTGDPDSVYSHSYDFVIDSVKLGDEGIYYCIVTNLKTGEKQTSEHYPLYVTHTPYIAFETSMKDKYAMCYQTIETLTALPTWEARPENKECNYSYIWQGPKILNSEEEQEIEISPRTTSDYRLIVTNETEKMSCRDSADIEVKVKRELFELPDIYRMDAPGELVLAPRKNVEGTTTWFIDGNENSHASIFSQDVQEDCEIAAEYIYNGCTLRDTTLVLLRKTQVYNGSEGDGYAASAPELEIMGVDYTPEVCERSAAYFKLRMLGTGIYRYEWRREGSTIDSVYCREYNFTIDSVTQDHVGAYYCIIYDQVTSKQLVRTPACQLTVKHTPRAIISSPYEGEVLCFGVPQLLDASQTEDYNPEYFDYVYTWSGANLPEFTDSCRIMVTPSIAGLYELKVSYNGCYSEAAVQININKVLFDIPSVIRVDEPGELTLAPRKEESGDLTIWTIENDGATDVYRGMDTLRY